MDLLRLSTASLVLATAGYAQNETDLQIRSVDFVGERIELANLGASNIDLGQWRICTHGLTSIRRYTSASGLNGRILAPGESLFIHMNNDASGATAVNASALGPFAAPFDRSAYAIQIFYPGPSGVVTSFAGTDIAAAVQWTDGGGLGAVANRTGQAVSAGVWANANDFVEVAPSTNRFELQALDATAQLESNDYVAIASAPYDEEVEGDLSDDRLAPTRLSLDVGDSSVAAHQQGDALGRDLDYLTIDVPVGQVLTELFVDGYVAAPGNQAFLGLQSGPIFTTDENSTTPADLLGGAIYGSQNVGQDILPLMGQLGTGFALPLGPGEYTFWFNQTGDNSEVLLRFVTDSNAVGAGYCTANPNSSGVPGRMVGTGSALVADNDLTVTAVDLPMNVVGFAIVSRDQGFVANPGGASAGNLCLGGSIGRYIPQVSNSGSTGQIVTVADLSALPQPNGPVAALPGETWNFQLWHRDSTAIGSATSNFTQGLSVTFQ